MESPIGPSNEPFLATNHAVFVLLCCRPKAFQNVSEEHPNCGVRSAGKLFHSFTLRGSSHARQEICMLHAPKIIGSWWAFSNSLPRLSRAWKELKLDEDVQEAALASERFALLNSVKVSWISDALWCSVLSRFSCSAVWFYWLSYGASGLRSISRKLIPFVPLDYRLTATPYALHPSECRQTEYSPQQSHIVHPTSFQ